MARTLHVLLGTCQALICGAAGIAIMSASTAQPAERGASGRIVGSAVSEPSTTQLPKAAPAPPKKKAPKARATAVRAVKAAAKPVAKPTARKVQRSAARIQQAAPAPAPAPAEAPAAEVTVERVSKQQEMDRAVEKIPGEIDPTIGWVLSEAYDSWGTADWNNNIVYINPKVPSNRMYDVVSHEYSHLLSVIPYDDVSKGIDAMNAYFGGTGLTGAERAADCMALQLGATWTHYTTCTDQRWRDGARRLLRGVKA